jgi:GNAT superfamily N-acetyltransferase
MPAARRPRLEEIPALALVLTRAFFDDPLFVYLFPDPAHRRDDLPAYFAWLLSDGADHGSSVSVLTHDLSSVIVWAPRRALGSGISPPFRSPDVDIRSRLVGEQDAPGYAGPPGLFFPFIGVMPMLQGAGRGTALMGALVADADRLRAPVRTGTTRVEAVTFLRRFGFEVTREISRTAAGPQRWQLERPSD